jgi:hypothetical protein
MKIVFCTMLVLVTGIRNMIYANPVDLNLQFEISEKHPGGMHPVAQLNFVRKQIQLGKQPIADAYKQLIEYAELAGSHQTNALADFKVPGYYTDSTNHRKNSRSLQSDSFDAYACALAFQLSGDEKYGIEAVRFLNAWGKLNKSYSDYDGSLVMAYSGTGMVMAAELLSGYKGWKPVDRQQFLTWVREVYRKSANEIRNRKNNWADWGRFGSILSAQLLDDDDEIKENIRLIKSDIFDKIADDGHMPHETARAANGIWYTYFSLAPITAACWVAYNATGEDLFHYKKGNRSIKKAVDYLYHYNMHATEWPWFQNPNKGSAEKWPGNLLEALSGIYNEDTRYSDYAKPARPISYNVHHFAWTFPTLMPVTLTSFR